MAKDTIEQHEIHSSEFQIGDGEVTHLKNPITDAFGTWDTRTEYAKGCSPLAALEDDASVVFMTETVHPIAGKNMVHIGKTPAAFDPRRGGEELLDAGTPGDYLLIQQSKREGNDEPVTTYRYMDAEDLREVEIRKNNKITVFGRNISVSRERDLNVQGKVIHVLSFSKAPHSSAT